MKNKLLSIWGVEVDINDRELLEAVAGTWVYTELVGELYNENGVSYQAVFINEDDHYGLPQFHIWGSDGSDCVISMIEPKYIRGEYYGDLELTDYGKQKLVEFFNLSPTNRRDSPYYDSTYWDWIRDNFNGNAGEDIVPEDIPNYRELN